MSGLDRAAQRDAAQSSRDACPASHARVRARCAGRPHPGARLRLDVVDERDQRVDREFDHIVDRRIVPAV